MKIDNTFTESGRRLTDAILKRVERELDFVFPADVREFYLTVNGGYPSKTEFGEGDDAYTFECFHPVKGTSGGDELGTFEGCCRYLRNEQHVIPWHLIPFASDPGGDYFCFSVDPNDLGTVYWFCGDHIDSPEGPLERVAGSLREVVENLQEEDYSQYEDEDEEDESD